MNLLSFALDWFCTGSVLIIQGLGMFTAWYIVRKRKRFFASPEKR